MINGINEKSYLKYFYEISKIYRKSGYESAIADYIIKFAKEHSLEYYTDSFYNVIVWKDASEGYEDREIIGLQAHTDMICEKEEYVTSNFENGVEVYEEDGYLKAKGTTLGADNGVGVCYLLAVLDSNEIKHPRIEAIFTTQEETTMDGVKNIDGSKLRSKKVISFDNFCLDEIWIGSANSREWYSYLNMNLCNISSEVAAYKLSVTNFLGGHSGMDIKDPKRGNAIKVIGNILRNEKIFISSINGGSAINVIPRDCVIEFCVKKDEEENTIKNIKEKVIVEKQKYLAGDIILTPIKNVDKLFDEKSSAKLIDFIYAFKNGALSFDINGNVVVSANFSIIDSKSEENIIKFQYAIRSNKKSICDVITKELKMLMKKYKIEIEKYEEWMGYEQADNGELINICRKKFIEVLGREPNILGVQACLECEYLAEKILDLQYVALGTNLYGAHSPNEKVEIASMESTWNVLKRVLETI